MTATQVAAVLAKTGPIVAIELARRTNTHIETLYGLLVAAEARGLVRVNQTMRPNVRVWEAMRGAS